MPSAAVTKVSDAIAARTASAGTRYQVVDTQTGRVIGNYGIRGQARAKADKMDNEYGAIRYAVKPLYSGGGTKITESIPLE